MVVYQGNKGSVCFYFNNKLVGSLPLGTKGRARTMEDYEKQRDKLLREALEAEPIKQIKKIFWRGLHKFQDSGLKMDNEFLCMTILCLIKLKQIDPEGDTEGLLVCGRHK